MRYAFLIALVIVVFMLFHKPESTTEQYTQGKVFKNILTATPDDVQTMVMLTQKKLSEQLKKCVYCIEVTGVDVNKDSGFTATFVFVVLSGFPYGVSVIANVKKGEKGELSVEEIKLQSTQMLEQANLYTEFVSGKDIEKETLPTIAELQALVNNV